jgi:DNA modification methylase
MSKALAVTYVPPRSLKPYAGNARTHSPRQIRQIADSIRQFGFTNPILVDGQRTVVAGHGRLKAAETLGLETVPIIRLAHLSDAERRAYILADNKLAEKASWDPEILRIELQYLAAADLSFDLTLTGFETPEIDLALGPAPSAETERVPALAPNQPVLTRPGDLWELGPHRLLCGDATRPDSFRILMKGARAGMVFIDPPYNVAIDGNARGLGKHRFDPFAMASGEMSAERFTAFLTDALALLARHSASGSIHYVCMDWRHLREVVTAGESTYGPLLNLAVWNKSNAGMGSFYRSKHELVFVFKSGKGRHTNNVELGRHGRYRTNVWDYPSPVLFGRDDATAIHPTVKPTALVADAICDASRHGAIVLDTFMGSGTTLLAAEQTGRVAYGLELDPRYVDLAIRRWVEATGGTVKHAVTGRPYGSKGRPKGAAAGA